MYILGAGGLLTSLSRATTDWARYLVGRGVCGNVATALNGVVDGAMRPGVAARSSGAALQQHPFEITDFSHDGADGAQHLWTGATFMSARTAQLAEFGNAEIINTSNAIRRTTKLMFLLMFNARTGRRMNISPNTAFIAWLLLYTAKCTIN